MESSKFNQGTFFYDYHHEDGYKSDGEQGWGNTRVVFLGVDGTEESKDVQWCLENDYFEIQEGLWSGEWYYHLHPEEKRWHYRRKKRTDEIREKRAQWHQRNSELEALQEEALVSVLMEDIGRQRPPSHLGTPSYKQEQGYHQGVWGHQGQGHQGQGYQQEQGLQTFWHHHPQGYAGAQSKISQNKASHPRGRQEVVESRKFQLLGHIIDWAEGDQGIVDRARTALQETDAFSFPCPSPYCNSWFPSQEIANLHGKNAGGKRHSCYRREAGLPVPTFYKNLNGTFKCRCCCRKFQTKELRDFHHKNLQLTNDMAQGWDHEEEKERFPCPVCGNWFFSPKIMEQHLRTQQGKAHIQYRRKNRIDS